MQSLLCNQNRSTELILKSGCQKEWTFLGWWMLLVAISGPVKVNQKWLFSGSSLETQQIKDHFWVRIWDFLPSILFSIQNSGLVLLPAEKSKLNLSLSLPVSNCKLLSRPTLWSVKTWVQTRENVWVSNPEFQAWELHFLVYFNRPRVVSVVSS